MTEQNGGDLWSAANLTNKDENATKEGGWLEMWSNLHDVAPNDWANAQQQLEYSIKTFNHRQLPPDI